MCAITASRTMRGDAPSVPVLKKACSAGIRNSLRSSAQNSGGSRPSGTIGRPLSSVTRDARVVASTVAGRKLSSALALASRAKKRRRVEAISLTLGMGLKLALLGATSTTERLMQARNMVLALALLPGLVAAQASPIQPSCTADRRGDRVVAIVQYPNGYVAEAPWRVAHVRAANSAHPA